MNENAEVITGKPYNRCIKCAYIGVRCDGPNPLAMVDPEAENPLTRLSEWCRLRKEYLHTLDSKWTNAYIAEQAQVAKATVDNFMAGKSTDVKLSSIVRIFKLLVNGTWGEYPCAMDEDAGQLELCNIRIAELEQENSQLRKDLADMTERKMHFKKLSEERWAQMQAKDEQLRDRGKFLDERRDFLLRKDKTISLLSVLLAICVVIIIGALVVDSLNPDIGFFWLDDMAAFIQGALHSGANNITGVQL